MASRLIPPSLLSLVRRRRRRYLTEVPHYSRAAPQRRRREGNDVTRLGQSFQVPAQVNRTSPPEHRPDRPHRTWSTPSLNPITPTTTTKHNITNTQADRTPPYSSLSHSASNSDRVAFQSSRRQSILPLYNRAPTHDITRKSQWPPASSPAPSPAPPASLSAPPATSRPPRPCATPSPRLCRPGNPSVLSVEGMS